MNNYLKEIEHLSWINSSDIQEEAINFLSRASDWDARNCIISTSKDVWENLIKAINKNEFIDKKKLLPDLLFLLKDLTWPGALEALEILKGLGKEIVYNDLKKMIIQANYVNDEMWIMNLNILSEYFGL